MANRTCCHAVRIDVRNRETLPRIRWIGGRGRKAGGDVSAVKGNDLGWGSRHCVSIDYRNIIVQGVGRDVDLHTEYVVVVCRRRYNRCA